MRIRSTGFTLIEVVLAVSLSAVLIASIAAAVRLNLVVLDRNRTEIERAQIARNILMNIKSDLRAGLQYKPADVSGLDELTASQLAIAGGGMDTSMLEGMDAGDVGEAASGVTGAGGQTGGGQTGGGQTGGGQTGGGQTGGGQTGGGSAAGPSFGQAPEGEEESTANQNIAAGPEPTRPGLYGNQTEILIDISRLPRIDQYNPLVTAQQGGAVSIPSDVKTVAYFVSQESLDESLPKIGAEESPQGGLYRRELDRAVGAFGFDIGGTVAALAETKLIASEVTAIQFRYYDGKDWQEQWDSAEVGFFPVAIEVTLIIDNGRMLGQAEAGMVGLGQFNPETMQMYRTVVFLPAAEDTSEEEGG